MMLGVLCFSVLVQSCTTITVTTTKSVPIERVVKVKGAEKHALYVKANNWMVDVFKNAKSVVQFADKESGTISGKYLLGTVFTANQYGPAVHAYASIRIQVKDGAARLVVTPEPFSYIEGNMYSLYSEQDANRDADALLVSFESAMKMEDNSDW